MWFYVWNTWAYYMSRYEQVTNWHISLYKSFICFKRVDTIWVHEYDFMGYMRGLITEKYNWSNELYKLLFHAIKTWFFFMWPIPFVYSTLSYMFDSSLYRSQNQTNKRDKAAYENTYLHSRLFMLSRLLFYVRIDMISCDLGYDFMWLKYPLTKQQHNKKITTACFWLSFSVV